MSSKLKIYFCGSIRAGRGDVDLYGRIVKMLGKYGEVLTPFVADPAVTAMGTDEGTATTDKDIHDRDVRLLQESHAIVAEVTQPSLGVGYEIGRSVAMGKKILCIYRPQPDKKLSAMIRGADSNDFVTKDYEEAQLQDIFDNFFKDVVKPGDKLDWKTYEPM